MRKGRGGGGGGVDRILSRHIELVAKKNYTPQQVVDQLRSTYPRLYSRPKGLVNRVEQILRRRNDAVVRDDASIDDDDDGNDTPDNTKRRKIDEKEKELQLNVSSINRNRDVSNNNSGGSSSTVASSEDRDDSASGEEASSTSEDAVYGEKFEPEFDLMKSLLRENLRRKANEQRKEVKKEDNVEMEIENKDDKTLSLVNKEPKSGDGPSKMNSKSKSSEKYGGEISDNGPMFKDLGGMNGVIQELEMQVIVPLYHPQLPRKFGVQPMAGILLHGPPGCGKTKLAHAIANETGVPFYKICATELVSGVSGASEENIRELFSKAYRTAPSIVFIDEIDAVASKRENLQREMERRIVIQLLTCMDESQRLVKPKDENADSESSDSSRPGHVLVIGATNRPDALDPALRRPGRFDREIMLGVPDEPARVQILSVLTSGLKVEGAFDLVKIARSTPGFVGADLAALANEASNLAMMRIIGKRKVEFAVEVADGEPWWRPPWSEEEMEKFSINMADFEKAAKMVQPCLRREGFSSIPDVKWDDVGGLSFLRQEFDRYVVRRIKFPEYYEGLGVNFETGFLLYGPPGCGKTLIAKAVANEAGANFIHIKGPELLNKYVGESELAVRTIFSRARTCSPCLLFFDEVDALTTKRGKEGGWVVERLLNQLLIELDGAEQRRGVYVIGATNRPEVMDPAILRPGRFGKLMYVPLPSPDERGMILKALARKMPIGATVDLMAIGKDGACENLSGADLSALMNVAAMTAVDDKLSSSPPRSGNGTPLTITNEHFKTALEKISPSVSDKQIQYYKHLSERFKAA